MSILLGILGGIGSGKSSITRLLEEAGCASIDADLEGHEVLDEPEVQSRLRRRFGPEIFEAGGRVRRPALAARVFGKPEELEALNGIVHPRVRERILEKIAAHRQAHPEGGPGRTPGDVLVLDVSLLAASPLLAECDRLLFVDASEDVRRARCSARGWDADEMARRERHQTPLEEKRRLADWILDNNGSIEEARLQAAEILKALQEPWTGSRRLRPFHEGEIRMDSS